MSKVTAILTKVDTVLKKSFRQELRDQGHYLTGALEKSIIGNIKENGSRLDLIGTALPYAEDLETGISAENINVAGSLNDMIKYVELRMGYRGKKAARVAFLILRKQSKEGNPTTGSYAYSKTGERKHFITNTKLKTDKSIDNLVFTGMDELINKEFSKQKSETI